MQTITVHPLTENPTEAWKELSKGRKVFKVNVKLPSKPQSHNQVRFVCMSDTHSLLHHIKFDVPDGDVYIHAGDFSRCGHIEEVKEFNRWLGTLPHKHKIVICGNHELSFDPKFVDIFKKKYEPSSRHTGILTKCETYGKGEDDIKEAVSTLNIKQYLSNCIYLEDMSVELYGIKIYGTPWQPEFGNWGFNLKRGKECLQKWELIPADTDILITHTPPLGYGDLACSGVRAGCVELLATIEQRVKPKYHVFGHIHEGYGVSSDGRIIYINASTCDINYMPNNLPIVFDFTIPDGHSKP